MIPTDFERKPQFEEIIRKKGTEMKAPLHQWTMLRNDPRLEAFIGASLEELHKRNQKAEEAKDIDAEVRRKAAEQGLPVRQVRTDTANITKIEDFLDAMKNITDDEHEMRKDM